MGFFFGSTFSQCSMRLSSMLGMSSWVQANISRLSWWFWKHFLLPAPQILTPPLVLIALLWLSKYDFLSLQILFGSTLELTPDPHESLLSCGQLKIWIWDNKSVQGPFSDAQPHVVRWRDNLTRPGFFLGSCIRNSTLDHMVQRLSAYFLSL